MGNISIWQLALLMGIVLVVFGTKRMRNFGSDLGGAIKGFRKAIQEDESGSGQKKNPPGKK
jgi:sec-independent protein translocase protein TatA